ncbi:MAG: NfeD family protein, partial [Clostridiales bacterium]|nr:NfeD family protein [Clostridiales bacterium]
MEQAVIWILGIIAFIILEAVTYQLVSIWFAIGALGGMIAAFSGVNFYVQ